MSAAARDATMMRAVQVVRTAVPESLSIASVPVPTLKPGQVLLRVHAFGINRADISQRKGTYPPPPGESEILGLECAGEVVEVAPGTELPERVRAQPSRVMALLAGGAYAEYVAAEADCLLPIPDATSMIEAAALPEAFLTGFQLCRRIGLLQSNEALLIHAGASGVGSALIQLAKLFGAVPIVTAGRDDKLDYCRKLGAAFACSYKSPDWAEQVRQFLAAQNRTGVDVILDPVGRSHFGSNQELINMDGRWVIYALMSGAVIDSFNLSLLMRKRVSLTGTTLRNRSKAYKAQLVREFFDEVYGAIANHAIRPNVAQVFEFEQIAQAHAFVETDQTMGKVIVRVIA